MKALKDCKVLVTPTSYGSQDTSLKTSLESMVGEVVYNTTGKPLSSTQLQEMLPGVDGFIAGLDEIDAAALAAGKELQVVARYGVGYNNVDLDAAKQAGVTVTNTPGANATAVAELTIALMLDLMRSVLPAAQQTKAGGWPRYKGLSLVGRVVGLVGLGAIGREVARRLAGFDCEIVAFDLFPNQEFAGKNKVTYLPLDDLLAKADVVSLHVPGLPETNGMVNQDFLGKMKDGAYLINTARGELVDEAALVAAIQSGKLRGAALDAFMEEPLAEGNPLLELEQVITTPHMGAHSDAATNAMGSMALADCLAVLQGNEPKYKIV